MLQIVLNNSETMTYCGHLMLKYATQYASKYGKQQWPHDWNRSVFIPIPKKGNAKVKVKSFSRVWLCESMDCRLPGASGDSPCSSSGKGTGVGCHYLLQGIFLTQGLNLDLPHCRQTLYHLSNREALLPHNCTHLQAGKSGGLPSMGSHRLRHYWSNLAAAAAAHASKVMLKILQARLQQYLNRELPDVQAGFRKRRGTRNQLPTSAGSLKKQESSRKTSTSALLTMPKPLTVWITTNCGKFFKT